MYDMRKTLVFINHRADAAENNNNNTGEPEDSNRIYLKLNTKSQKAGEKNEYIINELWNNFKWTTICVIGIKEK